LQLTFAAGKKMKTHPSCSVFDLTEEGEIPLTISHRVSKGLKIEKIDL